MKTPIHEFLKRLQALTQKEVNAWGGFKRLAADLGKRSPNHLLDEINPDRTFYKFGIKTLLEIMHRTNPSAFLALLCGEFDHLAVPPLEVEASGESPERLLLGLGAGLGIVQQLWLSATSPHSEGGERITESEREEITAALDEQIVQLYQTRQSLDATTPAQMEVA